MSVLIVRVLAVVSIVSASLLFAQNSTQPAPANQVSAVQASAPVPSSQTGPLLDRMPEIPSDKLTPEQKKAADEFAAGRGTPVFGPFVPLLRSPEVMLRAKAMGDYLRYKSSLPPKLNEFVILITARQWSQGYEWGVHYPIAMKAGLDPEIAKAVAEGRRPEKMPADEELVYAFCIELHRNQSVSDATYAKAVARFGEQGVIDMIGVNGYYTFLAMVLNAARTPSPKATAVPPLPPFPH